MKKINSWYLPDNENHLTKYVLKSDGYQQKQRAHALSFVKKFDVAIDVGAHVGLWSKDLSKKFALVYAFEPIAIHRECFRENIPDLNVSLWPNALGDKNAKVCFDFDPENTGHTRVNIDKAGEVEQITLDSLNLPVVNFIKLDCEGYEYFALLGAEQTIKRCKPVINIEQKRFLYPGVGQYDACRLLESYGMKFLGRCSDEFVYGW